MAPHGPSILLTTSCLQLPCWVPQFKHTVIKLEGTENVLLGARRWEKSQDLFQENPFRLIVQGSGGGTVKKSEDFTKRNKMDC